MGQRIGLVCRRSGLVTYFGQNRTHTNMMARQSQVDNIVSFAICRVALTN